jgi:hypothetical protein
VDRARGSSREEREDQRPRDRAHDDGTEQAGGLPRRGEGQQAQPDVGHDGQSHGLGSSPDRQRRERGGPVRETLESVDGVRRGLGNQRATSARRSAQ